MLLNMQEEMRQQKVEMLNMKEDIKNNINSNINEKFKSLENKNLLLEQKLETQIKITDNFERSNRRKNLLFFGVEETEKSYHDLENKLLDIINNKLNINCDETGIEFAKRLGKKSEKVRPIVVTLLTMGLKIQIQKNKKSLNGTLYYIKEDFPLEVLNKRKELQIELEKEKAQGKKAFLKYDKLVIIDKDAQAVQHQISNKKRILSESPETPENYKEHEKQNKKQPTKINKTNNMNNFIIKNLRFNYLNKARPTGRTLIIQ